MIAGSTNSNFYQEWLGQIESKCTQDAFIYIVGLSACLKDFVCYPKPHGVVNAFRFMSSENDKEQPFAFIPNNHWLLFYFRLPAVRSHRYSLADLKNIFESANENGTGEWTIKLQNIYDVQLLFQYLAVH
jgi:hypothetical protein